MSQPASRTLKALTAPRAAALAGVIFALLFAAVIVLLRSSVPEGAGPGSGWLNSGSPRIRVAAELMPFAGISFLWFIGVVRDGMGRLEDRFFSTLFLGSGLLFLAMMFSTAAVGAGLAAAGQSAGSMAGNGVGLFGQMVLLKLSKTYALRMAAVFMMSLATIWKRTDLMPDWLVWLSYLMAVVLIIAGDTTMWLSLSFPVWVGVVSVLLLTRAGVFESHRDAYRDRL